MLEAALSGCALVLGDIPSLRENWDGAARFVAPDDQTALAATLRGLIEDDAERERLGKRARDRAERFSPARQRDAYLHEYSNLVDLQLARGIASRSQP